jgi:hypothetical protein
MPTLSKPIIGIIEQVSIDNLASNVPAKIDTGADSSSIWASNIRIDPDGVLRFRLFDEGSPYFTGEELERTDFSVAKVRSSNGESEIRYRTEFVVTIRGRRIKALFNLSDRSRNTFKILIGRRTVSGKFLVDVSKGKDKLPPKRQLRRLTEEAQKNPYQFHQKYVEKDKE